jgi:hypothetical protein
MNGLNNLKRNKIKRNKIKRNTMKKLFNSIIIIAILLICINNYQDGIDVNYPLMQLSITIVWILIGYLMYKVTAIKLK